MALTSKIEASLSDLVKGNIWPDACPKENAKKEWIVYTLIQAQPREYGDDVDGEWGEMYQIHYVCAGQINYLKMKDEIRSRLRKSGFSLISLQAFYDDMAQSSHVIVAVDALEGM